MPMPSLNSNSLYNVPLPPSSSSPIPTPSSSSFSSRRNNKIARRRAPLQNIDSNNEHQHQHQHQHQHHHQHLEKDRQRIQMKKRSSSTRNIHGHSHNHSHKVFSFHQEEDDGHENNENNENDNNDNTENSFVHDNRRARPKSQFFNFQDFHYQTGRYRSPTHAAAAAVVSNSLSTATSASTSTSASLGNSFVSSSTSILSHSILTSPKHKHNVNVNNSVNVNVNASYDDSIMTNDASFSYYDHNHQQQYYHPPPPQQQQQPQHLNSSLPCIPYASICTHAMVYNHDVLGIDADASHHSHSSSSLENNHSNPPISISFAWKTSLAPHSVCRITSTPNIVAISTSGGFISLLNGANGSILASRQIQETQTQINCLPTEVLFVTTPRKKKEINIMEQMEEQEQKQEVMEDSLLIFTPSFPYQYSYGLINTPSSSSQSSSLNHTPSNLNHSYSSSSSKPLSSTTAASATAATPTPPTPASPMAVLVTGIHGTQLTSPDSSTVAQAAQQLGFHVLQFPSEEEQQYKHKHKHKHKHKTKHNEYNEHNEHNPKFHPKLKISAMNGYLLPHNNNNNDKTIRFLICDIQGKLHAYDYNLQTNQTIIVQSDIPIGTQHPYHDTTSSSQWETASPMSPLVRKKGWFCLPEVGIQIDNHCSQSPFFLIAACNEELQTSKICWYSVFTLECLAEYEICGTPLPFSVPSLSSFGSNYGIKTKAKTDTDEGEYPQDPPVLLAMEPILSCSPDSAVAVVLAVKPKSSEIDVDLHIVQALVSYKSTTSTTTSMMTLEVEKEDQEKGKESSKTTTDETTATTEEAATEEATTVVTALTATEGTTTATITNVTTPTTVSQKPKITISKPHFISKISHNPSKPRDFVQQIDIVSNSHIPYSFQYTVVNDSSSHECKSFTMDSSSASIGSYRLLLAQGKFDEADAFLIEMKQTLEQQLQLQQQQQELEHDSSSLQKSLLINSHFENPIKHINASESALWQLWNLLENPNIHLSTSLEHANVAKECLRRLSFGAVTGGETGVQSLIMGSRLISTWAAVMSHEPENDEYDEHDLEYKKNEKQSRGIQIYEFRTAVGGMKSAITGVLKVVPPTFTKVLKEEVQKLEEQISALTILEEVLVTKSDSDNDVEPMAPSNLYLSSPLSSVRSPCDLYRKLISNGALTVAERVRRSSCRSLITNKFMASCVLDLPIHLDPRTYSGWLRDIIGGLSLNDPIYKQVRSWACRAADAFDRKNSIANEDDGLHSSLVLLEVVCAASAKLSTRIHTSFATYSPFTEDNLSKTEQRVDLNPSTTPASLKSDLNSSISSITTSPNLSLIQDSAKKQNQSHESNQPEPSGLQTDDNDDEKRVIKKSRKNSKPSLTISIPSDAKFSPGSITAESRREILSVDDDEEIVDCETKFHNAKNLLRARSLGLPKKKVLLERYIDLGGANFIARELVSHFMKSNSLQDSNENDINDITMNVRPFCEDSDISFDDVIDKYTEELCNSGKRINSSNIIDASSLARCCSNALKKCNIVLRILRAGILCSEVPSNLIQLSSDAVKWASEHDHISKKEIKSELEEATRLLMIDSIVRRYCGNGAQDFFRVSDPRHAVKLVEHITRFVDDPKALSDALFLCESYVHISKSDVCALHLQNVIVADEPQPFSTDEEKNIDEKKKRVLLFNSFRAEQSATILQQLYETDESLAYEVGSRGVTFCSQTLNDCSQSIQSQNIQKRAMKASSAACSILKTMDEWSSDKNPPQLFSGLFSKFGVSSWALLRRQFDRILSLQTSFSIFLTLSDLNSVDVRRTVAMKILEPAVDIVKSKDTLDKYKFQSHLAQSIAKARRGCALLFDECGNGDITNWFDAVGSSACLLADSSNDIACFDLISVSGMLDDSNGAAASRALAVVAKALCERSSKDAQTFARDLNFQGLNYTSESDLLPNAMRCVLRASSLLQENALMSCPDSSLSSVTALSGMIEIITQVLVKADGDSGERIDKYRRNLEKETRTRREPFIKTNQNIDLLDQQISRPPPPTLHPSFYCGDGLLLPPLEALCYCMAHCTEQMEFFRVSNRNVRNEMNDSADLAHVLPDDIFSFLSSKGVWGVSLTILVHSTTSLACSLLPPSNLDDQCWYTHPCSIFDETTSCLVERCLGGSNRGIISGTIDSQLAVSHLLSLPVKQAFKIFRSALPSPINKRDFIRVVTLSNIGIMTANEGAQGRGNKSWKKQNQFVSQCTNLTSNARWWSVLKHFNVAFDPRGFGEDLGSNTSSKSRSSIEYAASLIPMLIQGSSKLLKNASKVLQLAIDFGNAFSVDPNIAPQKQIEFMFSPPMRVKTFADDTAFESHQKSDHEYPYSSISNSKQDIREDIQTCVSAAKVALQLLPSSMARSAVLRRCVIIMESKEESHKDYERHTSLLSLYYYELSRVLLEQKHAKQSHVRAFKEEIKRIESRQAVLVVLMSFFTDKQNRPDFPTFFLPFPNPFGSDRNKPKPKICGVLGSRIHKPSNPEFDPLLPLDEFFKTNMGTSNATALAPLCHPLGLPSGYVHARSLCVRFLKAKDNAACYPSFEFSVLPVITRLQAASDGAELAEWCSTQYEKDSNERLKCLECALSLAMQASCEAENIRRQAGENDDGSLARNESHALGRVKRIEAVHSYLADKIKVGEIFSMSSKTSSPKVQEIIDQILPRALKPIVNEHIAPENFVERILVEASMMAALASLNETVGFTVTHFRQIASIVYDACKALAERHSHVDVNECTHILARRWMLHGDDTPSTAGSREKYEKETVLNSNDLNMSRDMNSLKQTNMKKDDPDLNRKFDFAEEEDTVNFVMDLNSMRGGGWFDDVGLDNGLKLVEHVTAKEESNALKATGSTRETSDFSNARAALRIAFVILIKNGYFPSSKDHTDVESSTQNNIAFSRLSTTSNLFSKEPSPMSTRSENNFTEREMLKRFAKDLLDIIFAKSEDSVWNSQSTRHASESVRNNTHLSKNIPKTESLTFAMRHRALRSISFLCPQDVVSEVISRGDYMNTSTMRSSLILKEISFGLFIAMEIEAMGLPLPHSDLIQLSSMNFSSYARALWRHHGRNKCQGFKGRILRLLLELCLRGGHVGDGPLVVLVLEEMLKYELPRTLLCACELIVSLGEAVESLWTVGNGRGKEVVSTVLKTTIQMFFRDLQQTLSNDVDENECNSILERLKNVTTELGTKILGPQSGVLFIEMLCKLKVNCSNGDAIRTSLLDIAVDLACKLQEGQFRRSVFTTILSTNAGHEALLKRCGNSYVDHQVTRISSAGNILNTVSRIESSLRADLTNALAVRNSMEMTTID